MVGRKTLLGKSKYPFLRKTSQRQYTVAPNSVNLIGSITALNDDCWEIELEHEGHKVKGLVKSVPKYEINAEKSAVSTVGVILSKLKHPENGSLKQIKDWYFPDWD